MLTKQDSTLDQIMEAARSAENLGCGVEVMHLRRDRVVENFHVRRLCDGKWERLQNILADPDYPVARPVCAACRSDFVAG